MQCPDPQCVREEWVSPGDPNASFDQLWKHVFAAHAGYSRQRVGELMTEVEITT